MNKEQFCKSFRCSPEQVEALRAKNKTQIHAMYMQACRSGKSVNNFTREQLRQMLNGLELPLP